MARLYCWKQRPGGDARASRICHRRNGDSGERGDSNIENTSVDNAIFRGYVAVQAWHTRLSLRIGVNPLELPWRFLTGCASVFKLMGAGCAFIISRGLVRVGMVERLMFEETGPASDFLAIIDGRARRRMH